MTQETRQIIVNLLFAVGSEHTRNTDHYDIRKGKFRDKGCLICGAIKDAQNHLKKENNND